MAKFPIGLSFQRLGSFPLDDTCVVGTRAQLEDYIENDPRSYAGQIVYIIEEDDLCYLGANMDVRPVVASDFINEEELEDILNDRLDGLSLVKLTKEEFSALSEEEQNDESKLYIIIDTEEIDFSLYATKEEIDAELEQKANISHNHATSEIVGLDGILDNYDSTIEQLQNHNHEGVYADKDHSHGEIYADKTHKHMTNDISDLTNYLNNKKFAQSQITDLETTLESKADKGHLHTGAEVENWVNLDAYALKSELNKKVDKVNGKGLSTNDYTTEEKEKLASIDLSLYATVAYVDEQINTHEHNLATEEDINNIINNLFN
jgi:hypothetical protein